MGLLPALLGGACLLAIGLPISGVLFIWGQRVATRTGGGAWQAAAWAPLLAWLVGVAGSFGGWALSLATRSPVVSDVWEAVLVPSAVLSVALYAGSIVAFTIGSLRKPLAIKG